MSIRFTIIESCRSNGWLCRLLSFTVPPRTDVIYVVAGPHDDLSEGDGNEYHDLTSARQAYSDLVKELSTVRNWKAQARYDAEHGTINGYAPWQYNRER